MQDPVAAAAAGDINAHYELGVRLANGVGAADRPYYDLAASHFRQAADHGHPAAQAMLGLMYHRGQGVPRDDAEAYKWLTLAIAQQSPEQDAYALWREVIVRTMSADQVAAGETLAREWRAQR